MELVIQLYQYSIKNTDTPQIQFGKEIRQAEIDDCFKRNSDNTLFKKIHVLCESEANVQYFSNLLDDKNRCHVNFIIFGKQPLYSDLVEYVQRNISPDTLVCITNSDVFLDPNTNLDIILREVDSNVFMALTRHEYNDDTHSTCNNTSCPLIYQYQGSHDGFIFKTPVPDNLNYEMISIPQNIYGAEAVFMRAWHDTGKVLKNFCFDIRLFHKHKNAFYLSSYPTIANHTLCNIPPTVPTNRPDITSMIRKMI